MIEGSVDTIDLDIAAIIADDLSPEARSAALAEFARSVLADAETQDAAALGAEPVHTTTVDGLIGADEDKVRPEGTIEYTFDLLSDIFSWIADMLEQFAPVRTGRFKASIELYADGTAIDPKGEIPPASEYVFESTTAYASKIEGETGPPESSQAPNGVFEAVATLAAERYGNQANISFSYRRPIDGNSIYLTPVIAITIGS